MEIIGVIILFLLGIISRYLFPKLLVYRKYVTKYLLYIGLPLLVFVSLKGLDNNSLFEYGLISLIIILLTIVVVYFLVKFINIPEDSKFALFLCSSFGNTAYLGIPLLYILFGAVASGIASIFTLVSLILHLTIGLFLAHTYVHKKNTFKKLFSKPFILILLFILLLSRLNFNVPKIVFSIAHLGIYIAVFIIGSSLVFASLDRKVFGYSLIKLLLMPLISIPIILFLNVANPLVFIILAATPSAFINTPLVLEFKFDDKLSASLTTISTLIFMVAFFIFALICL